VKKETQKEPAPEEDEKPWWMKELALQNAVRHPNDPTYVSGHHFLQARSYSDNGGPSCGRWRRVQPG
jgi:hypothetical protein